MSPSQEMVASGGSQINWAWQMEIVSKPIFFVSKCGGKVNMVTILFIFFLIVTMIRGISSAGIRPLQWICCLTLKSIHMGLMTHGPSPVR